MEDITAAQTHDQARNRVVEDQGRHLVTEGSPFQPEQGGMTEQASQGGVLTAGGNRHIAKDPRIQQRIERATEGPQYEDGELFKAPSLVRASFEVPGRENARPMVKAPEHFAKQSGLEANFKTGVLQVPLAACDGSGELIPLKNFAPARFGVPTQISPAPSILGVLSQQNQLQIGSRSFVASAASTAVATMNSRDHDAYAVIDDPIDMKSFLSRASQ